MIFFLFCFISFNFIYFISFYSFYLIYLILSYFILFYLCVLFYFIPSINCISFYHCQFSSISFYISQFYFFILFYELQHQNITITVICNQLNMKYNICNHICNIFKWFCWYTQVYQSTTSTGQTFVTVCWDCPRHFCQHILLYLCFTIDMPCQEGRAWTLVLIVKKI